MRSANPYVTYFEAEADSIDLKCKKAVCSSINHTGVLAPRRTFEIDYSFLFVAVGEQPATFGTPGVAEHCFFMKEVTDSVRLRKRISEQFEAAVFAEDEERIRALLRFVVVGAGPTGVEFAGTLSDFLFNEVRVVYPKLIDLAEVVLVQSGTTILPVFDAALQDRALHNLEKLKVRVLTSVRVCAFLAPHCSHHFAACWGPWGHASSLEPEE